MGIECSRCLYSEDNVTSVRFDEDGVCNYCRSIEEMDRLYPTGDEGRQRLSSIADAIRKEGKGKQYDLILGVSGGCDSSYLVHLCHELHLRPLAVHFDNTWDSTIAVENIQSMLRPLGFDLWTYVVDNEEFDDIYKAMLLSGTPDSDVVTDLAFATVLRMACEKFDIKYIFEGHSFRTEGLCPIGWLYMDGRYISSVHKQFGTRPMSTYPNLWLRDFLRWTSKLDMQFIRPLYWLDYDKEKVKRFLADEYGWQWYGGHHLENRITSWVHQYFWPRRWGIDGRLLGHCALIRSSQITKEQARKELEIAPNCTLDHLEYVQKRFGWSDSELSAVMNAPKKTMADYPNYKRTFERLEPHFKTLADSGKIPRSFYMRYCFPQNSQRFTGHPVRWDFCKR
ncbi:MAG: N-acetyl sugar amidotransferase [Planctomycetota bacterium]|jgi:N-acetyl sugar amidotransferase